MQTDRRDGRWVYYTLNRDTLDEIEGAVGSFKRVEPLRRKKATCCD